MKTLEEHFIDWESSAFGYGYGDGETHILPALHAFFSTFSADQHSTTYDHRKLEQACGPVAAWLLINRLCGLNVLEYGTSPRFGWLTPEGVALRRFVLSHTPEQLIELCTDYEEDYMHCYPDHCNCDGGKCTNPFWESRKRAA